MKVALKEWASVALAMLRGHHHLLLRKGGIADPLQEFRLEHSRFLLFPTFEHQKAELVRAGRGHFVKQSEMYRQPEGVVRLDCWAEVTDVKRIADPSRLAEFQPFHIWSPEYVRQRVAYKPEKPLLLCLARVYQLESPAQIPDAPRYAGCKSWVPLEEEVSTENSRPVLDEQSWGAVRDAVRSLLY